MRRILAILTASLLLCPACLTDAPQGSPKPTPAAKPKPKRRLVVVPHLIGSRMTHARARLRLVGLTVKVTLVRYAKRRQLGRVFRQTPGPGARVPAGSPVKLWAFAATGSRFQGPIPTAPSAGPRPTVASRPAPRSDKYPRLAGAVTALEGDVKKVAGLPSVRERYQASLEVKRRVFRLRWQVIERLRRDRTSPELKGVLRRLLDLEMALDGAVRGRPKKAK
ncbi:MAG: PASTA domain-containing protein [Proteobacteria bacterium]|nr:PASTA domain-containing protein [Pseudomonadota bacterium]MBU1742172.1 PASTA domain-containing protein [Pseudomonadota bacterium]